MVQRQHRHWTRTNHAPFNSLWTLEPRHTNRLFATLLLGLQRLETAGVLPPAHHSMLEDMLEGWTLMDNHAA